jgi:hypothetical protein
MTSSKTGLFSATVGAFIIEFYKKMSPDSGDQTVALLGQISQQLANFPNGTYSITANRPPPPSASMICVNAMWLISLVFSLASALIATLLQEWASRYVETPHVPKKPNHRDRARIRSFLFLGTEVYKVRRIVQRAFLFIHLSVYLFFGGLVILFHTINKKVAIAVDIAVGLFVLAYFALSILPCLDMACPYRTPMSYILWYPSHALLSFTALCLHWFGIQLHELLVQSSLDAVTPSGPNQRILKLLIGWLVSGENAVKTHWQYITDGLGKSIIKGAIDAPGDGDRKIVTRLFNLLALGDESKLQKFAASIPRNRVLELIPPIDPESGRIVREPLTSLLRSCAASTQVAGLDEDVRKRSLLVCLDAIHHIAETASVPELNFVWANFANIGLMRELWDDSDTAIRVPSRSICALLARQVVREPLEGPQLSWLHDVTGESRNAIRNAGIVTRDRMNLKSFVYGVLSNQVGDLPTEDATSFKKTLVILLDARNESHDADSDTKFQRRLSGEVVWIQQHDPQGSAEVVGKLRSMFLFNMLLPGPAYPLPDPHAPL